MKPLKFAILIGVLCLIAGTALALDRMRSKQKLGQPGIRAVPTGDGVVMSIELPAQVPGFSSSNVPQSEVVTNFLPRDTSYAQRFYEAPDGFWANANIVLMGTDRSSIHKADYCLAGQGFQTLKKEEVRLAIDGPVPYEMPVAKWTVLKRVRQSDGSEAEVRGIYAFWFVADRRQTTDNTRRILTSYRDLLTRGVQQRWAYVSYLAVCRPGQEDAAFDRLKGLITASVPQFQLPPDEPVAAAPVRP